MGTTLRNRCETLALFVGGPADALLRMVAVDETGMPISHVYVPDEDGVTRHMYGVALGTDAVFEYLGPLAA